MVETGAELLGGKPSPGSLVTSGVPCQLGALEEASSQSPGHPAFREGSAPRSGDTINAPVCTWTPVLAASSPLGRTPEE